MPWVCERCGHRLDGNAPPCRQCGHTDLAQIRAERIPAELTPTTVFVWRCSSCSTNHGFRRTRCTECGAMGLQATYEHNPDETDDFGELITSIRHDADRPTARILNVITESAMWTIVFLVGLATVLLGVLFLIGGSPRFGGPLLVVGVFTLPSVRSKLGGVFGQRPPGWVAAIVYITGWIGALFWYNV